MGFPISSLVSQLPTNTTLPLELSPYQQQSLNDIRVLQNQGLLPPSLLPENPTPKQVKTALKVFEQDIIIGAHNISEVYNRIFSNYNAARDNANGRAGNQSIPRNVPEAYELFLDVVRDFAILQSEKKLFEQHGGKVILDALRTIPVNGVEENYTDKLSAQIAGRFQEAARAYQDSNIKTLNSYYTEAKAYLRKNEKKYQQYLQQQRG